MGCYFVLSLCLSFVLVLNPLSVIRYPLSESIKKRLGSDALDEIFNPIKIKARHRSKILYLQR